MAKDDAASHIDQVFAEGKLIDEAVAVAAAEAIERHRQAGNPIVVLRDGRITRVPPEELDDDSRDQAAVAEPPLTDADLTARRTAKELLSWFDHRLRVINSSPSVKRAALLHEGSFKKFYEEVYPFALFVQHLYAGREDVVCDLSAATGDRDFDAVIVDHSVTPSARRYVQLTTTTFNRDELWRMKHFLEHGRVSVFGKVHGPGTVESEFVAHEELLRRAFEAIEKAALRKSRFSHGSDYVLVVSFDDFLWFGTADDVAALTRFVNDRLVDWRLDVATLYVLGISGRTLLSFPVRRG